MVFVRLVKPLLRRWREVEVAKNPDEWFSYLKGRDVRGVRLLYQAPKNPQIPDRMAAGFVGGGGAWSMEVLLPGMRSEFWRGRWEVGNPDATDRRIWKASYGRVAEDGTKPFPLQNVEVTGERLLAALDAIHAFSARHGCNGFTDSFARAIGSLKGVGKTGYHQDLSPPGLLPPRALAVLDAAQSAWVFGGMGSWNDLGFEGADGEEYDRVSDQLYQTLTEAICVATNATENKGVGGSNL